MNADEQLQFLIEREATITLDQGRYVIHQDGHELGEPDADPQVAIDNAMRGWFAPEPERAPRKIKLDLTEEQRRIIDDLAVHLADRDKREREARERQQVEHAVCEYALELLHSYGPDIWADFTPGLEGQARVEDEICTLKEKLFAVFADRSRYRRAIQNVCSEYTISPLVRKVLETALFNPQPEVKDD